MPAWPMRRRRSSRRRYEVSTSNATGDAEASIMAAIMIVHMSQRPANSPRTDAPAPAILMPMAACIAVSSVAMRIAQAVRTR